MIWSVETEKIAIENARNGDPNAFQMLYENYSRYVYRRCLRFTHDPATAEDLSQDVFIQVWRKISSFRGDSTFKTWLHPIATNAYSCIYATIDDTHHLNSTTCGQETGGMLRSAFLRPRPVWMIAFCFIKWCLLFHRGTARH